MSPELDQLVSEVAAVTGAARPAWMEEDAPLLEGADGEQAFYLIGLIGGKDVGKSALANAIVGHEITARTSHGPGTETVTAYAHADQAEALGALLEREVPGRYSIVEHNISSLARQVLLDLPDIDSHWGQHLAVTRKMLRHMLFPIWIQSVEKYADRQPQELLVKVAAGNAPGNFVFCLNKVDQLERERVGSALADGFSTAVANPRGGRKNASAEADPTSGAAILELAEDYAARVGRVLSLDEPPRVWAISAIHPQRYELPALRELLTREKTQEAVRDSRAKAALRQKSSVLAWLEEQDLEGRTARLARLQEQAEEFVDDRLGEPLLGTLLPRLTDDPLYRQAVVDQCMAKRVSHWPIVNVLHAIFSTIGAFFRRNSEPVARPLSGTSGEALVDQQVMSMGTVGGGAASSGGQSLGQLVQTTFALLQQSYPQVSELYRERKLWEFVAATGAAGELRDRLIATVDRQRGAACARMERGGPWALLRGLLTIGALIWFPIVQPVFEAMIKEKKNIAATLVNILSITNLLSSLTFLLIYFSILWLVLRWDAQRRVNRQFARWKRLEDLDPELSLNAQTMDWLGKLSTPVRAARDQMTGLVRRVEALRQSV
jgi:hypothetical protein